MWTLNSIQIFTQDFNETNKNIIARIQPLSGGTVLHKFGYESTVYDLTGIVVGNTDKDALKALAMSNSTYDLVTPYTTISGVSVSNFKSKQRLGIICQTIRQDLATDSPIFDVSMEIYIED